MYLNKLDRNAKKGFWNLANALVRADGQISAEEAQMLKDYSGELALEDSDIPLEGTFEETARKLAGQSFTERKIIFFELLALAYADKSYSREERQEMKILQSAFQLSDEWTDALEKTLRDVLGVYAETERVVLGA